MTDAEVAVMERIASGLGLPNTQVFRSLEGNSTWIKGRFHSGIMETRRDRTQVHARAIVIFRKAPRCNRRDALP
ncbi:MAG: hypothetical protein ACI9W2_004469 [Gammaproteobacteria bacterium]|jgi:hypothetical protein